MPGQFFDTRTDSTFSRYSPGFYYFSVLTLFRPFFCNRRDSFSIVAQILPLLLTHPDLPFFGTHTDSTFSRYSHGFYYFSVLTLIRPFFCNRQDNFSIFTRILRFLGTLPDSTIFRYSHLFDPSPVLVRTIFRYSHGFYLFPVLARILSHFGTHIDSTIFL